MDLVHDAYIAGRWHGTTARFAVFDPLGGGIAGWCATPGPTRGAVLAAIRSKSPAVTDVRSL